MAYFAAKNLVHGEEPEAVLISNPDDLEEGETLIEADLLGPGRVWDATTESIRDRNEAELGEIEGVERARRREHESDVALVRNTNNPAIQAILRILDRNNLT